MANDATKRVVFISTFPPRKCGIATFTADLIANAAPAAQGHFDPLVVTMRSDSRLKYDDPVKFEIRQNVRRDYLCAADYINFSQLIWSPSSTNLAFLAARQVPTSACCSSV